VAPRRLSEPRASARAVFVSSLCAARRSPQSPAIDAGHPAPTLIPSYDLDGHARTLCGRADMGAYELGIGDFNCTRRVDLFDYAAWGLCATGPVAGPHPSSCEPLDFDADRDVDLSNFTGFQRVFEGN